MDKVVVIGGGASGMFAAVMLAEKGYSPVIIEKNEKLGKKLFITGKGRCNLTNDCDTETLLKNVVTNPKFLYSAFYGFSSADTISYFEGLGLKTKTERGGRVFPVSDHSSDVISVLKTKLERLKVEVIYNCTVRDIKVQQDVTDEKYTGSVKSVVCESAGKISEIMTDYVVVATGGMSYGSTGSTGDGYGFAERLGINVIKPRPALVPLEVSGDMCKELMGLSLKNVKLTFSAVVKNRRKEIFSEQGEMLFTHCGVSGPVVLSASSVIGRYIQNDVLLHIDFKPALSVAMLDERILRDFSHNNNKQFRNSLNELLPKAIIPYVIDKSGVDPYKQVNSVTREERIRLVETLKNFELPIAGLRSFNEAIITQGGIDVKEINPKNMESKKIKGLHFIGEVLDTDAFTGGFNLQIAWSTAAALE